MDVMQIVFILIAVITLGSALMVVTTRNMMHATLWLIAALFGIAVYYVILSAGFLAVAQVVIYIGAIATLMIFVVMMTRRIGKNEDPELNRNWPLAGLIALLLFGGITWMLSSWGGFWSQAAPIPENGNPLLELGQALVSPDAYILPFEFASVLLLTALVGAIMIAWQRNK